MNTSSKILLCVLNHSSSFIVRSQQLLKGVDKKDIVRSCNNLLLKHKEVREKIEQIREYYIYA